MNEKEKILERIAEKFLREGFFKITMDEVASELKISKKTIYKHFPSKTVLVEAVIDFYTTMIRHEFELVINSRENAIVKFANLLALIGKATAKINDKWLNDLQQHLPHVWKKFDDFRTKMINKNIGQLIEQGKKENLIIDVPTPIVLTVYISAVRATVNPEFVIHNNFSLKQAVEHTFNIIMNGILTDKGKKILATNKRKKNENK